MLLPCTHVPDLFWQYKGGAIVRRPQSRVSICQLHPVVLPHVSHFRQVPLRTSVKFPHSPQASPW